MQRRVYDTLNVLTALDMVKKDRNRIELLSDIHDVFGNEKDVNLLINEKSRDERQTKVKSTIESIKRRKQVIKERMKLKEQYFHEITVQVALLKKLVRRNIKNEDVDTNIKTSVKNNEENLTLAKFQITQRIHLPLLILEFQKNSKIEILMNEDHKELVLFSDAQ